jgi:hypothetical protein
MVKGAGHTCAGVNLGGRTLQGSIHPQRDHHLHSLSKRLFTRSAVNLAHLTLALEGLIQPRVHHFVSDLSTQFDHGWSQTVTLSHLEFVVSFGQRP